LYVAPAPVVKELLGKDETVINPYFMQQLLSYGIGLGKSNTHSDPEVLLKEAEVRV
jgi:serine/threonine-protein kinase TTK/MPS1